MAPLHPQQSLSLFSFGAPAASSFQSPSAGNIGSSTTRMSNGPASSLFAPDRSAQNERLLLALLPFEDTVAFYEWLGFLEGDWAEYCRDYLDPLYRAALYDATTGLPLDILDAVPNDAEPDKATTVSRATVAINRLSLLFLAYHPPPQDMHDWTAEDHAVRFMVTAIRDSLLRKVWAKQDWCKRPAKIARAVYAVLSYKRAGYAEYQQQRWEAQRKEHPPVWYKHL